MINSKESSTLIFESIKKFQNSDELLLFIEKNKLFLKNSSSDLPQIITKEDLEKIKNNSYGNLSGFILHERGLLQPSLIDIGSIVSLRFGNDLEECIFGTRFFFESNKGEFNGRDIIPYNSPLGKNIWGKGVGRYEYYLGNKESYVEIENIESPN